MHGWLLDYFHEYREFPLLWNAFIVVLVIGVAGYLIWGLYKKK